MAVQNQRPVFYEGQFLAADDLAAIVDYLRAVDARHALGAHTWGIGLGLTLSEKSAPGGRKRVQVTLQPGFCWDGFGRLLVNARPTRLPETLFAGIAFNSTTDNETTGTGRLVPVWIEYDESASKNPPPGFETCLTDDEHARIGEAFKFVVDAQTATEQRAPVTIGTSSIDATLALQTFDPSAPTLWDTSVPHQTLPSNGKPPRWLVPIGYVRWIARDQALGYFAERDLKPTDNAADRIRALRRYVGAVAEYIQAADGAIVLHRRDEDPQAPNRFASLMQNLPTFNATKLVAEDLVWVEGNLRVGGNAKLAGGRLLLRDGQGLDEKTPLAIAREGDSAGTDGQREMRLVIGDNTQTTVPTVNRLIVGPETPPVAPATVATIAPQLVVVSSGDVGIGRSDPETRLNVVGQRVRLQDRTAAPTKRIDLRTDGSDVGLESSTSAITIRAFGATATDKRVLLNPTSGDGSIGLRVAAPAFDIDAKGKSIKLGLEEDGGGQLVLTHDAADILCLEGRNAAGAAPASEVRVIGPAAAVLPLVTVKATTTQFTGNVGIGTPTPQEKLHVNGKFLRVDGMGLGPDQEQAYMGGDGVGRDVHVGSLNANVMKVVLFNMAANGGAGEDMDLQCRNVSCANVTGGNVTCSNVTCVGITTTQNVNLPAPIGPTPRLHVAAGFLLVDGAGTGAPGSPQELAYLGGDGVGGDVHVGSFNINVGRVVLWNMGNQSLMDLQCDAITANSATVAGQNVPSDGALKEHIRPILDGLATLRKLRGVQFRWKEGGPRAGEDDLGVIAQEVQSVLPQLVKESSQGRAVSYVSLVPLLIEAVKELAGRVDTLQAEVAQLKA